jgi:hypothetical protein
MIRRLKAVDPEFGPEVRVSQAKAFYNMKNHLKRGSIL